MEGLENARIKVGRNMRYGLLLRIIPAHGWRDDMVYRVLDATRGSLIRRKSKKVSKWERQSLTR